MLLKTHTTDDDPEELRDSIIYTHGQCEGHKLAIQFVPIFATLLEEWQVVFIRYLALRDKISRGESRIDGCDEELDIFVDNVSTTLLLINNNDRGSAEFRQYFGSLRPNEAKKPTLGDELELVRGWIEPLKASSNPLLQQLGARAETLVAEADAAVVALATAQQEYRAFRLTGEYLQFVDRLNANRKATYGELSQIPHQPEGKNLPANFADRFFRHETRRNKKKQTADSLQKQITALEGQLKKLRAALEDLEGKEVARVRAGAEREAFQAELAEVDKTRAELEKKAAELRAKLKT